MTETTGAAVTFDPPLLTTTDERILVVVEVDGAYFWEWCRVIGGNNE